jgi:hypothetical protein
MSAPATVINHSEGRDDEPIESYTRHREENLMKDRGGYLMTQEGAAHLAARLREYWWKRGLSADVRIEQTTTRGGGLLFCVRSNLVNGLPPGATASAVNGTSGEKPC